MRIVSKAAPVLQHRRNTTAKWPAPRWMNAFAVQEAHDLHVMQLETEAYVAMFGDRRKSACLSNS